MSIKRMASILLCIFMLVGMFSLAGCGEDEYVRSELTYEKDRKMCLEVLAEISNCQPGAAGSSIRSMSAAVSLLDWSHMSGLSEEDFEELLAEYLAGTDKELFALCFESVDAEVRRIISGETSRQTVGDMTGKNLTFRAYELEVYELYADIIRTVIS